MLTIGWTIAFLALDVILLVTFLAIGILFASNWESQLTAVETPGRFLDEALRALGASAIFMVVSGFLLSVALLTVMLRRRLFTNVRTIWLAMLFVLHATAFLFYLRGPAVFGSSVLIIAIGVVCVVATTSLEQLLWKKLRPRGQ